MPAVTALILGLLLAGQAAIPDQLVLSFTATDKKGKPVEDLKPEEVTVQENGASRPVEKLELDRRPLSVALVVDSGAAAGNALQADFVPAAVGFLKRLPPESTFSIWITSDRPKQLVADGTDVKAAEDVLRGTAAFGSNASVDAMVAASQELARLEGRRTAVVAITSASMGEVTIDIGAELTKASVRPTYMVVEVIIMEQDARLQDAVKMLTSRTGGFHERVFSTMAVDGQLLRVVDQLAGQYRASYRPTVDPRAAKIELRTSRKDAKVRMSMRLSAGW